MISGSIDQHIKFHDLESYKLVYNIKLPSALSSFDASSDGNHFAIGMSDGSFLLWSKKFTREYAEEELMDEEDKLF